MHLHRVVLLVSFIVGVNAVSALAAPNQAGIATLDQRAVPRSLTTDKKAAVQKRILRFDDVDEVDSEDEGDQERAGLPGISTLKDTLNTQWWLKRNVSPPYDVFKNLRIVEAGVSLDNNPTFIKWLEYVTQYTEKDGVFTDFSTFVFLTKSKPEDELVALFQSMKQAPNMKDLADKMQNYLFTFSPSSRSLQFEAWLKSRENPKEVFRILRLKEAYIEESPVLIQWLRYTEMYRAKMGDNSFSEFQTMNFLLDSHPLRIEAKFGTIFESIKKVPDLKRLAENLQTHLFQKFILVRKENPMEFGKMLVMPHGSWESLLTIPKNDPRFKTWVAYTVQYAEDLGGKSVMEKVRTLFDDNKPNAAFETAMKAS